MDTKQTPMHETRSLRNIRIVLCRPLYGGNVGSVCRAMMNMGLADLAIVKPGQVLDTHAIWTMSMHAYALYEGRREFDTLADAVATCHVVAGTTGRTGLYRAHARTPREWAPEFLASAQAGTVAIVFGPEDSGLTNDEIALCTRIIQIPSAPEYLSINLAQAVMICAYELYVASGQFEPVEEQSAEAPSELRERMLTAWEPALLKIGFMEPHTAEHMMLGIRRILSRGTLTERDVRILMGIARQTQWCADEMERLRMERKRDGNIE